MLDKRLLATTAGEGLLYCLEEASLFMRPVERAITTSVQGKTFDRYLFEDLGMKRTTMDARYITLQDSAKEHYQELAGEEREIIRQVSSSARTVHGETREVSCEV